MATLLPGGERKGHGDFHGRKPAGYRFVPLNLIPSMLHFRDGEIKMSFPVIRHNYREFIFIKLMSGSLWF